jgi:nucleotide-binding universal stress UspA family protein
MVAKRSLQPIEPARSTGSLGVLPQIKTILYATDLAPRAPVVFRHAVGVAKGVGARIVLLHALEPLGTTAASLVENVVPRDQLDAVRRQGLANVEKEIHSRLDAFCKQELGPGASERDVVAEIRILHGAPAQTILAEAARLPADLIVMGTHGHPALERFLVGSVASRVVQQSPIPVLLVPTDK